jgi:hypothetical protein
MSLQFITFIARDITGMVRQGTAIPQAQRVLVHDPLLMTTIQKLRLGSGVANHSV